MVGFKTIAAFFSLLLVQTALSQEKQLVLSNGGENYFVEEYQGGFVKPGTTDLILVKEDAVLYDVFLGRDECENFFDMGDLGLHRVSLYRETNQISHADTGKPFGLIGSGKMYRIVGSREIFKKRTFSIVGSSLRRDLFPLQWERPRPNIKISGFRSNFPPVIFKHGYIRGKKSVSILD